ncbi:hypothetical protein [uncultured Microbacterium sp.]|uniref:hypothetical protein n=1 Tax=uncultured Microbacterium sp. TaxID=191216 RepID=UPI0025D983CB|nr:hypothetical protein [uncultured Microbacterium sp.]
MSTKAHGIQAPKENAHESRDGYERVDVDRYAVMLTGVVGYVDVVPPLFVCYLGHPYPMSIEIAQVHDFELAVKTVQDHAAQARSSRTAG